MAENRIPSYIREHGPLATPIRASAIAGEAAVLKGLPAWRTGDRVARTLTKEGALRVVLLLLKAGAQLADHHADGPLSVQCVDGHVRFTAGDATIEMRSGDLVTVDRAITHAVEALDESVLLITIALDAEVRSRPTPAETP